MYANPPRLIWDQTQGVIIILRNAAASVCPRPGLLSMGEYGGGRRIWRSWGGQAERRRREGKEREGEVEGVKEKRWEKCETYICREADR